MDTTSTEIQTIPNLQAEIAELKARTTYLPYITDEMYEEFKDTCLMEWDTEINRPNWTQTAVDFCAVIPIEQLRKELK